MNIDRLLACFVTVVLVSVSGHAQACHEECHEHDDCMTACANYGCAGDLTVSLPSESDWVKLGSLLDTPYAEHTDANVNVTLQSWGPEGVFSKFDASDPGDVVEVFSGEATILCGEGLAKVVDSDTMLPPAADGSLPTRDFGPYLTSECFVPRSVYPMVMAYHVSGHFATPLTPGVRRS
ncbi:MAG: hypothetical protein OXQ89_04265 [Rhodospirillaceae bacterium]|nr:hypothetical protein [Rhodospirillaceae bacterium]